ncbi:MAG: hypothetical protein KAS32_10035 [Candidatus Peribacteraceae bacterium]|nr:hypothetical protein [Candidatus Peribacteraceae bacterium]
MRISTDKTDFGYKLYAYKHEVYLNNKIVSECITADEDLGFVIVLYRNPKGEFELNHSTNKPKTKIIKGKVKIKQ